MFGEVWWERRLNTGESLDDGLVGPPVEAVISTASSARTRAGASAEQQPEHAIDVPQPRAPLSLPLEDSELVPEGENFRLKLKA